MIVAEAVFLLLKEALFKKTDEKNIYPIDSAFWEEVYRELESQAVLGLTSVVALKHDEIPKDIKKNWGSRQRFSVVRYVQMYEAQKEAVCILEGDAIDVAVIKGMASACYFPIPEHRTMGDIDLLVRPRDYQRAIELLKKNGFVVEGKEESRYHTAFMRYGVLFELHQSPASIHKIAQGEEIKKYVLSGLEHVERCQTNYGEFPMLPWQQNGMELIWHIRQHLYNGLGLRHIVDWMMFVNEKLDDQHFEEYRENLERCGLLQLALHVTLLCQKYLGLRTEDITWCNSADEDACDELIAFLMEQGDFGRKKGLTDKTAKALSGYSNPKLFLKKMQEIGASTWKQAERNPVIRPLAWIYGTAYYARKILSQKGGLRKFIQDSNQGRKRRKMFERLYGKRK